MEALVPFQRNLSKCHQKWVHVYCISGQMTTSLTANFRFTFVGWLTYIHQSCMRKKKKKRYWASSYNNEFYITAKIMSDFWGKFGVMCLQQFRMSRGVQSAVVKCHHLTESVLISWCPSIIKISAASSCCKYLPTFYQKAQSLQFSIWAILSGGENNLAEFDF